MGKYKLDFSNVGDGGFTLPSEGHHVCQVKSVEVKDGKKAKYFNWTLVIGTGADKGKSVFHITSWSPEALFKLRDFLTACGLDVPKKTIVLDTNTCINKVVGVEIMHEDYVDKEGKKRRSARIIDVYQVSKGEKGFYRTDEKQDEEDDVPFDSSSVDEMTDEEEITDLDLDEDI